MPLTKKTRVLIVDDSLFFRTVLQKALSQDSGIEVIGSAANVVDAKKKINELSPDVLTLDEEMPNMTGTDFLKKMMPVHPLPVVLVSSLNIGVLEALHAGAVDFVRKPEIKSGRDFELFCNELAVKIKIASAAKIKKSISPEILKQVPALKLTSGSEHVIAIGASTGGTEATAAILQQLPADMPGILVTQHMPPGFTKMYADRLNRNCQMNVFEAKNGDRVQAGVAYIAPGDKHMTLAKDLKGYYVKCAEGEKVSGHCPSVDVLFHSVAKAAGKDAVGIILTGMGRDGANGLLTMKNTGAYTIGQDQQSCVVYGMPMEAYKCGAVLKQAPCRDIAGILIQHLNGKI